MTPVNRWLKSTAGSVASLAGIAAAAFWIWPFSLWQWVMLGAAVFVAFEWGETIGTCREQLLQAERDRRRELGIPDWREDRPDPPA
jgi:hypothetical protein